MVVCIDSVILEQAVSCGAVACFGEKGAVNAKWKGCI